jgi:hypothetical protein
MIIVSGRKKHLARYGWPQHWNRHTWPNKFTIRQAELEVDFFGQLQTEILAPDVIKLMVEIVKKAQKQRTSKSAMRNKSNSSKLSKPTSLRRSPRLGINRASLAAFSATRAV